MQVMDTHCDVLLKMWRENQLNFFAGKELSVNYPQMKRFNKMVQVMAIYIPMEVPHHQRKSVACQMIQILHERILEPAQGKIKLIMESDEIHKLKEDEMGVILSMEGCEPISDEEETFLLFYDLGVRIFGLTWNYANLFGDGVLEPRKAGLSIMGREFLNLCNEKSVIVDVSHLNEPGFWDCVSISHGVMASHSNSYTICPHPRNLTDLQIQAIVQKNGYIGITFVPQFLNNQSASITDVLKHLDYMCSLGAEHNIGFGSDFDGFEHPIFNLSKVEHYENLYENLLPYYKESQIRNFLSENFKKIVKF